jgi:subfamily B ATP-binding cassette protein MsbA
MENSSIARRLFALVRPYRARALLSLLAMAGTAATQPLLGKALELLLDKGFKNKVEFSLWLVPAVLVSLFIMRGVFTFATAYLNNWVMSRVLNDLRGMVFERLLRLPVARFHEESTGKIINTVIGDVRQVVDMINSVFLAFVRDTLVVAGLLIGLLMLNWKLTLIALVVVPLTAVIVRTTTGRLRRLNRDNQRVTGEMTQVVEEATRGHQVIRVFSGEAYERRRFEARSEALRGFSQRMTDRHRAGGVGGDRDRHPLPDERRRIHQFHHADADAAAAAQGAGRSERPDAARTVGRRNGVRDDRCAG